MTHTHLQSELRNLVAATLLDEVLQKLSQVFKNDSDKLNDITLFYTRHNLMSANYRKGLIEPKEHHQQVLQLANSILNLIGEITEEEATAYELENSIFTKILVVCKNEARKATMTHLLSDQFYKGLEFDVTGAMLTEDFINTFQFIIFDDMGNDDDSYYALYNSYLANVNPYLLYFGEKRVSSRNKFNVEKAYFANSIFSLHSRIQEMLTFLKYYKA